MIKLPNIKGIVGVAKGFSMAHRPELLLGTSIASTISAVVAAAVGGYKSGQQVLQAELDVDDEALAALKIQELSLKGKTQLTWLNYLPAAGLTAASLGSTSALHIVHVKEKKALAQAGLAVVAELQDELAVYKEEAEKVLTTKKADAVNEKVMEARADENGVVRTIDSDGAVEELYLVRDGKTGRDIWSNETRIDEAVNNTNRWLAKHGDCDLNTFYSHAGFGGIPDGDDWGWSGDFVELKWDLVSRDDGRPVRRFTFLKEPKAGAAS